MFADTYLEGNKVPTNTYQAKRMIRPVSMKLKKFHACPNHCIMYRGKYENWNAGCRMGMDDEGPKTRQKKKKTAKWIPFPEDKEEEGYL